MKLISWLVTLFLMTQISFAQAPMTLKEIIDSYHYALTVEWDQKDKDFMYEQDALLKARIGAIIEQVTADDLAAAFPGVNVEEIEGVISANDLNTTDKVIEFIQNNPRTYARGASWEGDVGATIGLTLGGAALILMGIRVLVIAKQDFKQRRECEARGGAWAVDGDYCF